MTAKWRVAGVLAAVLAVAGAAPVVTYDTTPESNTRFLADFAKLPGVTKLADGLMYRVLEKADSTGVGPVSRYDTVTVEYRGWMINGKVFDQSKPEEPRVFVVGNLIPGWREALMKMKTGDRWQLAVPADLAYADEGVGTVIPPGQSLIFMVRLKKVEYAP
jgi:FKBP-type peptidyl-prolyl cis-trans isomerase